MQILVNGTLWESSSGAADLPDLGNVSIVREGASLLLRSTNGMIVKVPNKF